MNPRAIKWCLLSLGCFMFGAVSMHDGATLAMSVYLIMAIISAFVASYVSEGHP